jgi:hypothetical protein
LLYHVVHKAPTQSKFHTLNLGKLTNTPLKWWQHCPQPSIIAFFLKMNW